MFSENMEKEILKEIKDVKFYISSFLSDIKTIIRSSLDTTRSISFASTLSSELSTELRRGCDSMTKAVVDEMRRQHSEAIHTEINASGDLTEQVKLAKEVERLKTELAKTNEHAQDSISNAYLRGVVAGRGDA